jgi:hypothetical protein
MVSNFEDREAPREPAQASATPSDDGAPCLGAIAAALDAVMSVRSELTEPCPLRFERALHSLGYVVLRARGPADISLVKATDGSVTLSLAGLSLRQCRDALEALARMDQVNTDEF